MKTDAELIDDLIRREGSTYTNRLSDRGGPTKYGITLATLGKFRKRAVTAADVQALTETEARSCYVSMFIIEPGFAAVANNALRALLVDAGVQHGPDDAVRWLQQVLAVKVDGDIGEKTLQALAAADARHVFADIVALRCSYYGQLVTKDPTLKKAREVGLHLQAENAHGWANRLAEFIRETAVL